MTLQIRLDLELELELQRRAAQQNTSAESLALEMLRKELGGKKRLSW